MVMRRMMNALAVTLLMAPVLLLGQADEATRVLSNMRAALGGEDEVAAIKTMTAEGMIQRVTRRGTIELEMELAVELPDKYVTRTQLTNQGNMSIYRSAGFNGDGLINETEAPPNLSGAGGGDRLRDRPLSPPTPEQRAAANLRVMTAAKKNFARMALGMFGSSYNGFPLQFSYAGLAESPDGSAHVIRAQGAEGFGLRLFVDTVTHLPLMLTWSEPRRPNPRNAAGEAPTLVEHRIYYSNFKSVDDLILPHTLRHSVDGNVTEETTLEEIKINPEIDSKRFETSK